MEREEGIVGEGGNPVGKIREKIRDIMRKMGDKEYFVGGAGLFAAAVLLQVLARNVTGMATWYAHHVYPLLVRVIGGFFGFFSFIHFIAGCYLCNRSRLADACRADKKSNGRFRILKFNRLWLAEF